MAKHSARYIMRQQKKLDKKLRRKPKNINADGDTTMMPLHQTITLDHLTKPKELKSLQQPRSDETLK